MNRFTLFRLGWKRRSWHNWEIALRKQLAEMTDRKDEYRRLNTELREHLDASKHQLAAREQQWISIDDKLPDTKDDLWVCYLDNGKQYITIGGIVQIGEISRWSDVYGDGDGMGDDTIYGVTHWMPMDIPEPPKAPPTSDYTE